MSEVLFFGACVAALFALAMNRAPLWVWAVAAAVATFLYQQGFASGTFEAQPFGPLTVLAWVPALLLTLSSMPDLRRRYIVAPTFEAIRKILPKISDTEQQALDAGTVGFDAELFSGRPDWNKLRAVPGIVLSPEERAFLDGPTEELCRMIDGWRIRHGEMEIPADVWDFVKRHGFLGMLISKAHGGLGFSPQAQSLILGKIASRSPDAVTIVMVPNSLGPGELIEKYGTDDQKEHFLPRLARGDEVPCFSLTGPTSGSDAATMRDVGYVTRGQHQGKDTLGIRLSWDKRYITLGPVATLLGLAFHLYDPDKLLGSADDVGITLAIIPADHPGVNIGRRHLPCGAAFPNGPNWGKDVFIPMEFVIGGEKMAGHGWRMLMECLVGRSRDLAAVVGRLPAPSRCCVSPPPMAASENSSACRSQRWKASKSRSTRMVETAYANEAARAATAAMVSRGEKPAVISALMKYQSTERLRRTVNDAMDLHGGRGICDGPTNYLLSAYQMVPVGITVEGANILTRTLITFAQGALRSHPYLYKEIAAAQEPDRAKGLEQFETAFLGHVAFAVSNVFGALFHNVTGGLLAKTPAACEGTAEWYRQLWRASRNFALVADLTVAMLGGGLKVKQKLTGRLADALSELYFLACALKRYEDDGRPAADAKIVALVAQNGLHRFEESIAGTIDNFPVAPARWLMRFVVFPFGRAYRPAPDRLGHEVVKMAIEPGDVRDRLTRYIYISKDPNDPTGLLEVTLEKVVAAEEIEKKLDRAVRAGTVRRVHGTDWIGDAAKAGVVTEQEAGLLREVETLTARVIAVDHFDPAELKPNYASLGHNSRPMAELAAE